ncbi:hypothetical protein [Paenibacillus sp. GYB003]|uniref:hypothetical protein n=1 Tax=Paenibacillus sp. GYB003 TaxID=2994392 RepID=UPI002F96CD6D
MASYNDRDYYKSVNGRIAVLLRRVPDYRPLPEDILSEIDSMPIRDRENIAFSADALIGLMQAQINELKAIKERAERCPTLQVLNVSGRESMVKKNIYLLTCPIVKGNFRQKIM